ncbi:MAG: helix-turn-helix domain-containing protein [Roseibium sp.]|uniref:helix-turn-helix domain-containing protein n=1 Tax=Roseibium polysiphoniae TaxID=2571221 RepID=UPI00329A7439
MGLINSTNRNLMPVRVSFCHQRSRHISDFNRAFGCPVDFGEENISLRLKVDDLKIPLLSSDDKLLNLLRDICDSILQSRSTNRPQFLDEVERKIVESLPDGNARAKTIAVEMGLSERTFLRRLSDNGATFQNLLQHLRKELACDYLKKTELPITQVAFLIGYSDATSFSHSFKRWTGVSPSVYLRDIRSSV